MTRRQGGFGVLDVLILIVVGGGLLAAAALSDRLVARGDDGSDLAPPPIRWRDQFFGVATAGEGTIWLAGSGGKIVRSDDGGSTWTVQTTPVAENLQDIDAWDGERAVAVGNDGIVIVTRDGGASWLQVEAPRSEVANKLIRVMAAADGRAWAVGVMGMILFSDDWGETWQRRSEEVDVAWNGIAFADDANAWVVGEFGSMMHSSDGGSTWAAVEPTSERSLMAVAFRDPVNGVAVGLDGLLLRTVDGGATWTELEPGTPLHLFDVTWAGDRWIAVGGMGVIVTGTDDAESWSARRLSEHDLGWHTEAEPVVGGVYIVGATQGLWHQDQWTPVGVG